MSETLFPIPQVEPGATQVATSAAPTKAAPRMRRANRDQILLQPSHLESLLKTRPAREDPANANRRPSCARKRAPIRGAPLDVARA